MKTIKLYGHLGKRFGRVHRYDVRTPADAVKALMANFPDFKTHLLKHNEPGYRVLVGKENRSSGTELHFPADNSTISIVPAVAGRGDFGKIIIGAALITLAIYAPDLGMSMIESGFSQGVVDAAMLGAQIAGGVGISLALGGISNLLFKPPKAKARDAEEQKGSINFNGPLNLNTQGNPVPLAYGQVMIGSQVIYARIKTTKLAV